MGDNQFDQNAPAPMEQFKDAYYKVDEHNQRLLDDEKARQFKILDKPTLKSAQAKLEKIQAILDEHQVDAMLTERQNLIAEFEVLKEQYHNAKEKLATNPDSQSIKSQIAILWSNRQQIIDDTKIVKQRIRPYRKLVIKRDVLKGRIDEHINTELDFMQAEKDKKDMAKEAELFAGIIVKNLAGIGFAYERRRNNKVKRDLVRFEKIIVTPDDIQFKIDVSKIGLLDGIIRHLPNGVRGHHIADEDVLIHLTIACERQVVSPNMDKRCDWSKGVWLQLYRHNYRDGLMNYVSYEQVMQRYPNDQHDKFPVPAGVKAGRYINWINLVDHPHWLFAGQTGSGKTNLMRALISSLISTHSPDEIRFVFIDLKRSGAFNAYRKTPHILGDIEKTVEGTAEAVRKLEILMHDRMTQIGDTSDDILDYNRIAQPENRMPLIILVFDEYGAIWAKGKDLGKEIEASMKMIATQSRAAGIIGWLGIQQSYSDTIDKMVKGNATIAFSGRQRTLGGSMSVGSSGDAMKIKKIPGRMICDDGGDTYQIQAPFLSKTAMHKSVAVTSKWDKPRQLDLPSLVTAEEEAEPIEPFNEDMVIRIALEEFDGVVSARRIWEHINRHDISRRMVEDTARNLGEKMIANNGEIEFKGKVYMHKKYGRTFQLVFPDNPISQPENIPLLDETAGNNREMEVV